jgi:heat shock protein HslJ
MMKVLFITLLLVLTLQLRLTTHQDDTTDGSDAPPQAPADNPLFGLTFFVQDPANQTENVGQVLFTDQVHFMGCNSNWAGYSAKTDGSFHVDGDWASTKMACLDDRDQEITGLFQASTKFELVHDERGTKATLFDEAGQ